MTYIVHAWSIHVLETTKCGLFQDKVGNVSPDICRVICPECLSVAQAEHRRGEVRIEVGLIRPLRFPSNETDHGWSEGGSDG
jgi:hypothetical protein